MGILSTLHPSALPMLRGAISRKPAAPLPSPSPSLLVRSMASHTASASASASSPFTQAVVSSMRKLYPEALAEKSFDNTGLLLEAPFDPLRRQMNSVLLAIDLTRAVADEAIENGHCVVVAYHPIIFRGLKALTLADSQQSSLLRLALQGISVYSPHTAVDAVPGGMADWLCDIVTGQLSAPEPETHTADFPPDTIPEEDEASSTAAEDAPKDDPMANENQSNPPQRPRPGLQRQYSKPTYPKPTPLAATELSPDAIPHTSHVIKPCSLSSLSSLPNPQDFPLGKTGAGRLIKFDTPQPLTHLIERIARGVGTPKGFPVAIPQGSQVEDLQIRSVGICPGSGGSVLKDCDADLLFTGELSHHEALAATERGAAVVTLFHSNSERGYLHSVMKEMLETTLKGEWNRVRDGIMAEGIVTEDLEDALGDEECRVEVSERDRDPYGVVILEYSKQEGTKI